MPASETTEKRRRVLILDTVRGAALVHMLIFHTLFDLACMFGAKWAVPAYVNQNEHWIIYCTASFVFMAGMTVLFSRNPALHGAKLLAVAAVFPIVTAFFFDGSAIYFGVLHLLAVGMLFYAVARNVIEKIPWWVGIAVCALLFAFTFNTMYGFWGFGEFIKMPVPAALTANNNLYPYGFITGGYSSADYLPMLPWLFLFLAGCFAGRLFRRNDLPKLCYRDICPPLTWLGKHSLVIYVVHQPIIYALLYVIFKFIK